MSASNDEIKCERNPLVDKSIAKPDLERVREWKHGDKGLGKQCDQADVPIYTKPNEIAPRSCDSWNSGVGICDNDEYYSKGMVTRNKTDGKVIDREYERQNK